MADINHEQKDYMKHHLYMMDRIKKQVEYVKVSIGDVIQYFPSQVPTGYPLW